MHAKLTGFPEQALHCVPLSPPLDKCLEVGMPRSSVMPNDNKLNLMSGNIHRLHYELRVHIHIRVYVYLYAVETVCESRFRVGN